MNTLCVKRQEIRHYFDWQFNSLSITLNTKTRMYWKHSICVCVMQAIWRMFSHHGRINVCSQKSHKVKTSCSLTFCVPENEEETTTTTTTTKQANKQPKKKPIIIKLPVYFPSASYHSQRLTPSLTVPSLSVLTIYWCKMYRDCHSEHDYFEVIYQDFHQKQTQWWRTRVLKVMKMIPL